MWAKKINARRDASGRGGRRWRVAAAALLLGGLSLSAPAPALQNVFNSDRSSSRTLKVCILLLQATHWENPEPFFLPTLAYGQAGTDRDQAYLEPVRNLRPGSWVLDNPLAPKEVTEDIQRLWNKQTGSTNAGDPVVFDGVSALVDNDNANNGNDTLAEATTNEGRYTNGNLGGPNNYYSHCRPVHLYYYGANGAATSGALPALGANIPSTHPAYWEVPLTPRTVSQLANFDVVFVNTHRNLHFTAEEQILLRQFLAQGGNLYLEDSHGSRMAVRAGGDETDPGDVDFFFPFQFVDGWPYSRDGSGLRSDGYPINTGGVTTQSPSKTLVSSAASHPLINGLYDLTGDFDRLGDVRAWDHLIIRNSPAYYRVEEILRTRNTDDNWGDPDGTNQLTDLEPALAVVQVGAGRLILSGMDCIDDCSRPYEDLEAPNEDNLPDIEFMYNLLAWTSGAQEVGTLQPRFLWHWPSDWDTPANYADADVQTATAASLQTDPDFLLREPLAAANGRVFVQYQVGTSYWLVAVSADPEDTTLADAVTDQSALGSQSNTLWRVELDAPVAGAVVTTIENNDRLIFTQAGAGNTVHLRAVNATDGGDYATWDDVTYTTADGLDPDQISAPTVFEDRIYFTAAVSHGYTPTIEANASDAALDGEWTQVFCAYLQTGGEVWRYPNPSYAGEQLPADINSGTWQQADTLKQSDAVQDFGYGYDTDSATAGSQPLDPNYGTADVNYLAIGGTTGTRQERCVPTDSPVVPTLRAATHLKPVIGLTRDERTGLTAPTVYLNRANGDVWAVACEPEALGWRIDGTAITGLTVTASSGDVSANFELSTVQAYNSVTDTYTTVANELTLVDTAAARSWYRGLAAYTSLLLNFTQDTVARQREVRVYPRHRLLRADRHSGYETDDGGVIDLLGYGTAAPLLYDDSTLVGTSTALWLGIHEPSASYEKRVLTGAQTGVGRGTAADASPNAGQIRSSGPVTFFRAGADANAQGAMSVSSAGCVKWAFDPNLIVRDEDYPAIDTNMKAALVAGNSPTQAPQSRSSISLTGSPVRVGDTVVVAGTVRETDGDRYGVMIGLNPEPSFVAPVAGLNRAYKSYLLTVHPNSTAQVPSGFDQLGLDYYPSGSYVRPLLYYVVDPRQYALDYDAGVLQLRADQAHLTRLAVPIPDTAIVTGEPAPEALRLPLYGRLLWLVQDVNSNGTYDSATDTVSTVYVPSPVQWVYYPDTVVMNVDELVNVTEIRVAGSSTALTAGTDYQLDFDRPIIRLTDAAAPALRGRELEITYNTSTATGVQARYTAPRLVPGFTFTPAVAGDWVYVSGTQMGSLGSTAIGSGNLDGATPANDYGGLYGFRFGHRDQVVDQVWLRPDTVPTWPNFNHTGLDAQYVRGAPLVLGDALFASFGLVNGGEMVTPLYCLGDSRLLVTESQRVVELDYEGRVSQQFVAASEMDGLSQPQNNPNYTPLPRAFLTTTMTRPTRAYRMSGGDVLVVDTGGDRVIRLNQSGQIVWPLDKRTGHPDGLLRYLGLRDLGLNRPRDAVQFEVNEPEHPLRDNDAAAPDYSNLQPEDYVDKTITVIADTGNRRVIMVKSQDTAGPFWDTMNAALTSGRYSYFEPLLRATTGFGEPYELTSPQVYNPTTKKWVELAYSQLQVWQASAANANSRYYVVRAEGSDQLFYLDPDPDDDGLLDENQDGVIDGLTRNLAEMIDPWSGGMVFRGLRCFHRFQVGPANYLAIIQDDQANAGRAKLVVYSYDAGDTPPITAEWDFDLQDYRDQVYDPANTTAQSYYRRLGISQALRQTWYGWNTSTSTGTKQWNPSSVRWLPSRHLLAIVNGAVNSVNQTASNSEVLLVRFNAQDYSVKRVEHVLPDLSTTSTYPAGQAASQRRPELGTYPVSSPVFVDQ